MSSTMIYTACEWEVDARQLPYIRALHEMLEQAQGNLHIIPQVVWYESHLMIDTFILRTLSPDTVEAVKHLCEGKLILSNWHIASEIEYAQDFAFNPFRMPNYDRHTWEARVHMAGEHNRRIRVPRLPVRKPLIYGPSQAREAPEQLIARIISALRRTGTFDINMALDLLQGGPDAMLALKNMDEPVFDAFIEKLRAKKHYPPDISDT